MSENSSAATQQKEGGMKVEAASDYQSIYSNFFRYRITHNELSLTFSTILDKGGDVGPSTILDRVQIMMSLPQAKSLLEYMTMLLSKYEEEVGPILTAGRAPPSPQEVERMFAILRQLGSH